MTKKKKFSAPVGASLVVVSSFFYASYGIWTKLMGNFFDGYTAATIRSVIVVLILLIVAFIYRKFEPIHVRKNWLYILGMLIGSMFTWGPLYFAILQAGVGVSLAVAYASLVIGMFFFGWLFASERFTKEKAISAVLGIIGLILIFSPTASGLTLLALGAALLSGISTAISTIFVKKVHYNSTQSTIVLWASGIVANSFMAFILGKSYPMFNFQIEWLYLFIFAIASIIASWSLVRGIKLIDAGSAGVLGLLEIVFGVIFGIAFFHERPTTIALMGMGVIIIAAAIPYMKDVNVKSGTLD